MIGLSSGSWAAVVAAHPSLERLTIVEINPGYLKLIPKYPDVAGLLPVTQRRGRRFGVVDGYLRPALRRPNLTVATSARVTRLLIEDRRAVGVAYLLDGGGEEDEALAGEVVVSAGTIGSPQLLQLSGIGDRDALERVGVDVVHHLPGVGVSARCEGFASSSAAMRTSLRSCE